MCGVCLTSSPRVESRIAGSEAPAPVEPETRVDRYRAELDRVEKLRPRTPERRERLRALRLAIGRAWAAIDDGPAPTRYTGPGPGLKGGLS